MKDSEKRELLARLQSIVNRGENLTLHECEISEETFRELKDEQLIKFSVRQDGLERKTEDSVSILSLTSTASSWAMLYDEKQSARRRSLTGRIGSMLGSRLPDLFWALILVALGAILLWSLEKCVGIKAPS